MCWLRLVVGCRDCGPHPHIRRHPRLFEYPFNGFIHIVGCLEAGVVLDELGGSDVGIRRVQMRDHMEGGDVGIAEIAGSDST